MKSFIITTALLWVHQQVWQGPEDAWGSDEEEPSVCRSLAWVWSTAQVCQPSPGWLHAGNSAEDT